MFRTVSLSIIMSFSLNTQSNRYVNIIQVMLTACKLYDIHHCCVYSARLLMMDRETVRNRQSSIPKINLRN